MVSETYENDSKRAPICNVASVIVIHGAIIWEGWTLALATACYSFAPGLQALGGRGEATSATCPEGMHGVDQPLILHSILITPI